MGALLESGIKKAVASAFKGRLLTGTLRRASAASLNSLGDPIAGPASTYTFDGIRDSFNAVYAAGAGIPVTDVRILVILGSGTLTVEPRKDDDVKIDGRWYRVREVREIDPAGATATLQAYELEEDPA